MWGIGQNVEIWMFAAFAGNLPLPFLSANLTTIMRTKVPIEMQGRVFSTRDTFQYITIPIGFFLAGIWQTIFLNPLCLIYLLSSRCFQSLWGQEGGLVWQ
jgi:hypothetical protein